MAKEFQYSFKIKQQNKVAVSKKKFTLKKTVTKRETKIFNEQVHPKIDRFNVTSE